MPIAEGNHVYLEILLQLQRYSNTNIAYTRTLKPAGAIVDQQWTPQEGEIYTRGEKALGGTLPGMVNVTMRLGLIDSSRPCRSHRNLVHLIK